MQIRIALLLKIVAFMLGCLCTAVIAFALYVWFTLDLGKIESELTRQLGEQSRRILRIEDGLQLSLWPRPALRFAAASLSEAGSDTPFAEIGPTRLSLALKPLLWRDIVIERIDSQGGSFRFVRQRDGSWNSGNLADTLEGLGVGRLALEELSLRQASLHLRDEGSGLELALGNLLLRVPDLQAGRGPLLLSAQLDAKRPALSGAVQLGGELEWPEASPQRALTALQARFAGSAGKLVDARLQLSLARLAWQAGQSGWAVEQLAASFGAKDKARPLDFSVDLPALRWENDAPHAASLAATLNLGVTPELDGDAASTLNLSLSEIGPIKGGIGAARLAAQWQGDDKQEKTPPYQVSLSSPLRFEQERATLRLDQIEGEARFDAPWLRTAGRSVRLAGSASWRLADPLKNEDERPGRFGLELAAGADRLRADGRLADWLPLNGQLDLVGKQLDGDALIDPAAAPAVALPLAALQRHKFAGRLRVERVRLGGLDFSGLDTPYAWGDGRFELSELRLAQDGAKANGKLAYDGASGQLAGQFKLDKLDTRALAAHAGLNLPLSGRADGSLALEARGSDSQALRDSLQQQWQLRYALPVLEGVDLARSLRELRPAWLAKTTAARSCHADERTELASLSLGARLRGQVLDIEQLEASASWLALSATGRAELSVDTLTLQTRTTATNPAIRSFTRDLADLKGVAVPLQISHNRGKTSVSLSPK